MAKSSLPSVDGPVVALQKMGEAYQKTKQVEEVENDHCQPRLPPRHAFRRGDVRLSTLHADELRDAMREMQDSRVTLRDGGIVSSKADAIRWLIENVKIVRKAD